MLKYSGIDPQSTCSAQHQCNASHSGSLLQYQCKSSYRCHFYIWCKIILLSKNHCVQPLWLNVLKLFYWRLQAQESPERDPPIDLLLFFSPRIGSLLFITLCRHFLPRPIFQWQFFVGVIILRLCNLLAAFLDIMSDALYAAASKIFVQPPNNTQNTIQYNTIPSCNIKDLCATT